MKHEVLVFRTNITSKKNVARLEPHLNSLVGKNQWNIALDDSDKILRVVSDRSVLQTTIHLLHEKGFECAELED